MPARERKLAANGDRRRRTNPVTIISAVILGILLFWAFKGCGAPQATAPESESPPEAASVPGLMPADIKINLEDTWGLDFDGPEKLIDLWLDHGEAVDPDTGAMLVCDIYENAAGLDVAWVEFTVDASGVAGQTSVELITALASGFLGYCATLPYEGADPEAAKAWVEDNAAKAIGEGNLLTNDIGGARFLFYGMPYIRVLEVKPSDEEGL